MQNTEMLVLVSSVYSNNGRKTCKTLLSVHPKTAKEKRRNKSENGY